MPALTAFRTTAASSPAFSDDLAQRLLDGAGQQADAHRLVLVRAFQVLQTLQRADQRHTTTRRHAFFNGGTRGMQRVFDAGLLFLHLDFGSGADLDHSG